ncbi:hypothetical protein PO002_06430, partial [Cupriavidus necator]|uniref:hypothetical protein n=1 Tax=Cupriavidus necator TaxID=106590 RepID=UPI0039C34424
MIDDWRLVAAGDMLSLFEPLGSALLGGFLFVRATKRNQKARRLRLAFIKEAAWVVRAAVISVSMGSAVRA